MLAHLHVIGCPCSRCRVAREYARLLATVAPSPVAERPQVLTAEFDVPLTLTEGFDRDAVPLNTSHSSSVNLDLRGMGSGPRAGIVGA